jgi:hypothetical protein
VQVLVAKMAPKMAAILPHTLPVASIATKMVS